MAEIDVTRIAGNIGAMNSLNALSQINKQLSVHQTRLSTGKRINSAADDPAGLTIATKMLSRSEGLKVALSNIGDAKNLLAVAESGLGRINDILVQMRNKSEQAASDTLGANERAAVVTQLKAYAAQIDDIAAQTEWNGNKLIDGTYSSKSLTFQTGVGKDDYTTVSGLTNMSATGTDSLALATKNTTAGVIGGVDTGSAGAVSSVSFAGGATVASGSYSVQVSALVDLDADTTADDATVKIFKDGTEVHSADLNNYAATNTVVYNGMTVTLDGTANKTGSVYAVRSGETLLRSGGTTGNNLVTADDFRNYMDFIGQKLDTVSAQLSNIGAMTGRLTFKEDQVSAAQINVEAAYNRIMNANMAEEQVNSSKFQILQQTATAMLAQANAAPQFLLSLFR